MSCRLRIPEDCDRETDNQANIEERYRGVKMGAETQTERNENADCQYASDGDQLDCHRVLGQ